MEQLFGISVRDFRKEERLHIMNEADLAREIARQIAKEVYHDGLQPAVKATGDFVALLPRSINAALSPLHQWLLEREYNIDMTKKLLEEKLRNVSPDAIQSPEPYIAVPALQYISYCKDSAELRDMYANLLASAMNEVVKDGVHPSYLEIIKQLCPDEAKILRRLSIWPVAAMIDVMAMDENMKGVEITRKFSNIGEIAKCEHPLETGKYFDNLVRLGLIEIEKGKKLEDEDVYNQLQNHPRIVELVHEHEKLETKYKIIAYRKGCVQLTDFGTGFAKVCLTVNGD